MGFNLLGAIGGAVGGLFTGGPIGAAIGGLEGCFGSSDGTAASAPFQMPQLPQTPDTISTLLGQVNPLEDMTSSLDAGELDALGADSRDAQASIASFA